MTNHKVDLCNDEITKNDAWVGRQYANAKFASLEDIDLDSPDEKASAEEWYQARRADLKLTAILFEGAIRSYFDVA
jgi:hypothetical protein